MDSLRERKQYFINSAFFSNGVFFFFLIVKGRADNIKIMVWGLWRGLIDLP